MTKIGHELGYDQHIWDVHTCNEQLESTQPHRALHIMKYHLLKFRSMEGKYPLIFTSIFC